MCSLFFQVMPAFHFFFIVLFISSSQMTFLTCRRSRRRQSQQCHLSTRWTRMCRTRSQTRARSLPTPTGWRSWLTSPRARRARCYRRVPSAGQRTFSSITIVLMVTPQQWWWRWVCSGLSRVCGTVFPALQPAPPAVAVIYIPMRGPCPELCLPLVATAVSAAG